MNVEPHVYQPSAIEPKWQKYWDDHRCFETKLDTTKKKYYVLDMFPYPSGDGLHVGHPEGYTATDILCRMKRMQGFNVLHPMGWDAFGLPAERYAMKTGTHPAKRTEECIRNFKRQIKSLGFSYDWSREINTTDPKYFKWTQWIFKTLHNKGLAYISEEPVNWSDHYKTVVANEEVQDGMYEGHPVKRIRMRQWVLKITAYAERLLNDLELVQWPESTKEMQKNWIGKSEGASVQFFVQAGGSQHALEVFTTRPDTLFGVSFMVVAPEHPLLKSVPATHLKAVQKYQEQASLKSDLARTDLAKEKSGVDTGLRATHPITGQIIPVYTADYVLMTYGTGAVMAVPGHDERDHAFALQFKLPIIQVVRPVTGEWDIQEQPFADEGVAMNSQFLNDLQTATAKEKMIQWLEQQKKGVRKVQYKLRDWLFSRQRYWGEPFPVIHWEDGTLSLVDDSDLPVTLPEVEKYEPSGTGESPLATISEWLHVIDPKTGKKGRRETNTMPQWAGSCWYYLRYLDPHNDINAWSAEAEKYWMPVDLYVGGAEHAVLHLLYARFWHKVLYDCGLVSTPEPFRRLVHQGMILGSDGEKMSKSRGNVVNPDDVVKQYGADAFRLYEMFMGPLERSKPWNTTGVEGVSRFLQRANRWVRSATIQVMDEKTIPEEQHKAIHKLIQAVTHDTETLSFNTAIAKMMTFMNECIHWDVVAKSVAERFVLVMAPYAPHLGEELWEFLGHKQTLSHGPWPTFDEQWVTESTIEIAVQVNGKMRGNIMLARDASEESAVKAALENSGVQRHVADGKIKKVIYKAGRILNLIV